MKYIKRLWFLLIVTLLIPIVAVFSLCDLYWDIIKGDEDHLPWNYEDKGYWF